MRTIIRVFVGVCIKQGYLELTATSDVTRLYTFWNEFIRWLWSEDMCMLI